MKNPSILLAICLIFLLPAVVGAQSNAEPSLHVALAPCQVFSGNLAANTNTHLDVRGLCNVAEEATAVVFAVHVTATGTGTLKLWEYDGTQPSANAMSYNSGTSSSFADVRVCAPIWDCFNDFSARSTTAITLTLVVEGFYLPPV
ncbi:MAG TPA: hypothetical protein VNW71_14755 [Thermoanaerobaculia bacterium]|nr:hypothetical protein [Thermoanaerobaculia bacterium]